MRTLTELLSERAQQTPDRIGFRFLLDESDAGQTLTYGDLFQQASAVSEGIAEHLQPGDRAILTYPSGLDFVRAFFGCLLAGVVPVPAPPPESRAEHAFARLQAIVHDCQPGAILSTSDVVGALSGLADGAVGEARLLATDRWGLQPGHAPVIDVDADKLAFIQYTSGSTAAPRGVMIRHRNVLSNLEAFSHATRTHSDCLGVMWLPLHHDMGLAGGLLHCLYAAFPCVFTSPGTFLERPMRWLKIISRFGATHSGAPNFAYELCALRARARDIEQLDLSRWEVAYNGSEPVRPETLDKFCTTFSPAGFNRTALQPCYGLAESVVFVSGAWNGTPALVLPLNATELRRNRVRRANGDDASDIRSLVSCGSIAPHHEVIIVDPPSQTPQADGCVGEIWLAGPSVAEGYWNRPDESRQVFVNDPDSKPYLRTGDLGFVHDGRLFVTGRLKDLIVIRGTNHYPQDIEATVEACHRAIRNRGSAAFSVDYDGERLVVVAEMRPNADTAEVMAAMRRAVAEQHKLSLDGIALVAPRTLPKTSSGKVRRADCRTAWCERSLVTDLRWESKALRDATPRQDAAGTGNVRDIRSAILDAVDDPRLAADLGACLVDVLEPEGAAIDIDEPVDNLGLDSVAIAQFKATVKDRLGLDLPMPLLLKGATLREIANDLVSQHERNRSRRALGPPPVPEDAERFERHVNPALGRLMRQLRMDKRYVRGEGCWLFDADGKRYLDLLAGYGSVPFGHNPVEIWEAIRSVRERAEPCFVQPSSLDAAGELAQRLLAIAPPGMSYVAFANSGAEAVEAALKLARAATGRHAILSTVNGFHGKTLGALSATGRRSYQKSFGAPVPGFEFIPYSDSEALESVLAENPEGFAALVLEPIQGEGGIVEPDPDYLRRARELCTRYGVKLILDEVQTGLGRTGSVFAADHHGIAPDILVLAKALGGGIVPVAAVIYEAGCYSEQFARRHSSTFAGSALACRAALATVDLLQVGDFDIVHKVRARGERLAEGLRELAARHPALASVRGRGYMLGIELSSDLGDMAGDSLLRHFAEQSTLAPLLASYLLNVERVRVAPTLLRSNVIRIEPPLTIAPDLLDRLIDKLDRALSLIENGDSARLLQHLTDGETSSEAAATTPPAPSPRAAAVHLDKAGSSTWAFLAHPLTLGDYRDFDPALTQFSDAQIGGLSELCNDMMEPFVAGSAVVRSATGTSVHGDLILIPRTADALLNDDFDDSMSVIRQAVDLARRRGAQIVGLGGFISVITDAGADLHDAGVALTSGNAYTAAASIDCVLELLQRIELAPSDACVAIVGAGGSVGGAVSTLLSETVGRLMLVGNPAHPQRAEAQLRQTAGAIVDYASKIQGRPGSIAAAVNGLAQSPADEIVDALQSRGLLVICAASEVKLDDADAVVTATSSPDVLIDRASLKPGAFAIDVSRPFNIGREECTRDDVLVVDGGLVAMPDGSTLGCHFGLPPATAFACMCEPMLLALENRFYGSPRIDAELVQRLRGYATRHGFRLAPLSGADGMLTDEHFSRVSAARRHRLATT